jgi:hypothetical protein
VRLVDNLSGEDRVPIFGLHLQPFEGSSVPLTELVLHHYAVEFRCTLSPHLTNLPAMFHTPIR